VTTVEVGTQVSGTIKTLGADFNSKVRKGEIVAELDSSLFETQVAQEQATMTRLRAEVERACVQAADAKVKLNSASSPKELTPGAISCSRSDQCRRRVGEVRRGAAVQAQASLNQAQVTLSHTIIRADR
jgi:HlyD family secretion protein